jgi:hypothetical protein
VSLPFVHLLTARNSIGQCLSLAASFLFPSNEGPSYTKGCIINIAFQSFGLLIALAMTTYYRLENKRRDREEGGRPVVGTHLETHEFYDKAPGELAGACSWVLLIFRLPIHCLGESRCVYWVYY